MSSMNCAVMPVQIMPGHTAFTRTLPQPAIWFSRAAVIARLTILQSARVMRCAARMEGRLETYAALLALSVISCEQSRSMARKLELTIASSRHRMSSGNYASHPKEVFNASTSGVAHLKS